MGKPDTGSRIRLHASDVSGQKLVSLSEVPVDATIGEITRPLPLKMKLPPNDVSGRPLAYHALLEREGRHLHDSERVGDVLQPEDRIVLQPNIDAGGL